MNQHAKEQEEQHKVKAPDVHFAYNGVTAPTRKKEQNPSIQEKKLAQLSLPEL